MNDLLSSFSQGLPGSINNGPTSRLFNHFRITFDVNSGPLSERIYLGYPRVINSSDKTSITSNEVNFLSHNRAQTLTSKPIYNRQNPKGSLVFCPFMNKIIRPNMKLTDWARSHSNVFRAKSNSLTRFI